MASRNSPINRLRQRNTMERVLGRMQVRNTQGTWLQRILQPKWQHMAQATMLSPQTEAQVRMQLLRAGFPLGLSAREFVVFKRVLAFLTTALFPAVIGAVQDWFGLDISWYIYLIAGVLGLFVGYVGPALWLTSISRQRLKVMQRSLPDFVDLITVSVEAGLGLVASLQEVSSRFRGPLSDEISRMLAELRVGRSFNDALKDMAARINHDDFSQFTSQIIQAEQLGVSIGNALRAQSQMMRERRQQRAQEAAQKAPVKMMLPLVFFILPTLFIVIMGPAAIMAADVLKRTQAF